MRKLLYSFFCFLFFYGLTSFSQNITIKGKIHSLKDSTAINDVKIVVIKVADGARIDSIQSDLNGDFELTYMWNYLNDKNFNLHDLYFPYPYDYNKNITYFFDSPKNENYKLIICSDTISTLYEHEMLIKEGVGSVKIYRETSCILISINFSNYSETTGINYPNYRGDCNTLTEIDIIKGNPLHGIYPGDNIRLEFFKKGCEKMDTTFVINSQHFIDLIMREKK